MKTIASATFVALAASLTLVACSTDDAPLPPPGGGTGPGGNAASRSTFTYNADVVPSDPAFNEAVEVRPDSLVLPRAGFESLLGSLQANQVVFGEWAAGQPARNPEGFLRRVESVREEGGNIVIATRAAGLDDLFAEAEIFVNTSESDTDVSPTDLELMAPPARTGGVLSFNPKASFGFDTGGTSQGNGNLQGQGSIEFDFYLHPFVNGSWSKKSWYPSGNQLDFDIGFPFDMSAKACAALRGTLSNNDVNYLERMFKAKNLKTLIESPPIPIGTPLGLTAKLNAKATCFPIATAGVQLQSEARVYGDPGIKLGYNGGWYATPRSDFGASASATAIIDGSVGVRCEVTLGLEVSSYGTVAITTGYVPYLDNTLNGSGRRTLAAGASQDDTPNHASSRDHGSLCLRTNFSHRADVKAALQIFGRDISSYTQTVWNGDSYRLNDLCLENKCSANDDVDTWYCSNRSNTEKLLGISIEASESRHAYTCSRSSGGGTAFNGNFHCAEGTVCQPNGAGDWRAQLDESGNPKCGTETVQAANDESLSCVSSAGWAGPR